MRILYGIQGTGNGHISRARGLLPGLQTVADVDLLVSGTDTELSLPGPIKYRYHGLGYRFGRRGGIDVPRSIREFRPLQLMEDMNRLPVESYDLVISDFEPISAWAARRAGVPSLAMSHQAAFLSERVPRPARRSRWAEGLLRHYAPTDTAVGFHFQRYDEFILPPVIRQEIRDARPVRTDQVTIYLPAWDEKHLIPVLNTFPTIEWVIFSKRVRHTSRYGNVQVRPVHGRAYVDSLVRSRGLICGAGFEAPSEAICLKKELMVVPMRGQYEQACNAESLRLLGGSVVSRLDRTFRNRLESWLDRAHVVELDLPDPTPDVMERVVEQARFSLPLAVA